MKIGVILPSAGSGKRLGLGRPKALAEVGGLALVRQTAARFVGVGGVIEAVVVSPAGYIPEMQAALTGLEWPGCAVRVVAGAATRQESVRCGLHALGQPVDIVCVHDAARPLVSRATIDAVLSAAERTGAATAASRPADSVRQELDDGSTTSLDRSRLWLVETPQAFRYDVLRRAHDRALATGVTATDDASLVERCADARVAIVESDTPNFKITKAEDLKLVRLILQRRVGA